VKTLGRRTSVFRVISITSVELFARRILREYHLQWIDKNEIEAAVPWNTFKTEAHSEVWHLLDEANARLCSTGLLKEFVP